MKVFVTGATGFVGTKLVEELIKAGYQAHCLVRKTSKLSRLKELGASLCYGDVTDKESILKGMQDCAWGVNLANLYSYWEPDKKNYTKINIRGTQNVMEAALETNLAKIVHVSSIIVYGNNTGDIITEECKMSSEHGSEYARTKYAGDLTAWDLYEKNNLPLVVIYPVGIIGPGDPKLTGKYLENLIAGKIPSLVFRDATFTFVHVRDVSLAIIKALEKDHNIGEKYIVGKYQMSYGEYSRLICEIAEVPAPKNTMSDALTMFLAKIFTVIANLTKKPPLWDMSTDAVRTLSAGFKADGSKAEKELGITYTPIHTALEEAVAACREESKI